MSWTINEAGDAVWMENGAPAQFRPQQSEVDRIYDPASNGGWSYQPGNPEQGIEPSWINPQSGQMSSGDYFPTGEMRAAYDAVPKTADPGFGSMVREFVNSGGFKVAMMPIGGMMGSALGAATGLGDMAGNALVKGGLGALTGGAQGALTGAAGSLGGSLLGGGMGSYPEIGVGADSGGGFGVSGGDVINADNPYTPGGDFGGGGYPAIGTGADTGGGFGVPGGDVINTDNPPYYPPQDAPTGPQGGYNGGGSDVERLADANINTQPSVPVDPAMDNPYTPPSGSGLPGSVKDWAKAGAIGLGGLGAAGLLPSIGGGPPAPGSTFTPSTPFNPGAPAPQSPRAAQPLMPLPTADGGGGSGWSYSPQPVKQEMGANQTLLGPAAPSAPMFQAYPTVAPGAGATGLPPGVPSMYPGLATGLVPGMAGSFGLTPAQAAGANAAPATLLGR